VQKSAVVAGSASGSTWGSDLSDWHVLTREWISLVSSRTLLGRLDAMRVPFQTRTITEAGVDAAYARALPVASASLTATAKLDRLPIGCIVVYTRELFETWAAGSEQSILRVLERAIRRGVDSAVIDPDSAASAGERPASLLSGVSPLGLLGSTAATSLTSFGTLLDAMIDAESDGERVIFAMHPSTALQLSLLVNSNGDKTYPDLGPWGGSILNVPVVTSAVRARDRERENVACLTAESPDRRRCIRDQHVERCVF
jgi:HK97 family phage major capsid protein